MQSRSKPLEINTVVRHKIDGVLTVHIRMYDFVFRRWFYYCCNGLWYDETVVHPVANQTPQDGE